MAEVSYSDDGLKEAVRLQGRKLGFFLAAANMPRKIKEALVVLLPRFSLEQLDKLAAVFEARYLSEQAEKIKASEIGRLGERLKEILAGYKAESGKNLNEAKEKIRELIQKIKGK